MLTTLEIVPAIRELGHIGFGEWMIDGTSLRTWIDLHTGHAAVWDVVGLPAHARVATRMIGVLRRRSEPELKSGRAVLYRCPECLDLSCGVLAVRVTREGDDIVWADFAWESDRESVSPRGDVAHSVLPELRFAAAKYDELLRNVVARPVS